MVNDSLEFENQENRRVDFLRQIPLLQRDIQ
jgi:hypothetical protein